MSEELWIDVCDARELIKGSGIAVRLGDTALAVFLDPDGEIHAVEHVDPASGAEVIAWGILGERDGDWYVASPLYKQKYRLRDGRCIDGEAPDLSCRVARVANGRVQVSHVADALPLRAAIQSGDAGSTISA